MSTIELPFVQLKTLFKECAKATGQDLSDRQAHRMAQGFLLSNAAEESDLQHQDDTGEKAVKAALLFYVRKFGSLRAPATS